MFDNAVDAKQERPVAISKPPSSILTDVATSINLTCTAEGSPAPSYKWYKDNSSTPIPGETRSYLYISEAQPNDRGNYSCEAVNILGGRLSNPATVNIPGE